MQRTRSLRVAGDQLAVSRQNDLGQGAAIGGREAVEAGDDRAGKYQIGRCQHADASYEFRLIIEPAMMLLDKFNIDQEAVERLRQDHLKLLDAATRGRPIDRMWTYDLDASFHETIAGFSGNTFLIQSIQQHNRLRRLIEYRGYGRYERVKAWAAEHLAILDALQRGLPKRAADGMRRHLTNAMNATRGVKG
jgi:DNA-binding GntR family transcriptional regulator